VYRVRRQLHSEPLEVPVDPRLVLLLETPWQREFSDHTETHPSFLALCQEEMRLSWNSVKSLHRDFLWRRPPEELGWALVHTLADPSSWGPPLGACVFQHTASTRVRISIGQLSLSPEEGVLLAQQAQHLLSLERVLNFARYEEYLRPGRGAPDHSTIARLRETSSPTNLRRYAKISVFAS